MPWKHASLAGERLTFVIAALDKSRPLTVLCEEFGVSTKTGYKWLKRYLEQGPEGLSDQSRRPRRSPKQITQDWLDEILAVRTKEPTWGGKKIHAELRSKYPRRKIPKIRTIDKWLSKLGKTRKRRSRAKKGPGLPPTTTVPNKSNDMWTVDFKGRFQTKDNQRVDPLTVRDHYSRYILGIDIQQGQKESSVRKYMCRLFKTYGLPRSILVDHGVPFSAVGALDLSRLSVWWIRLGIRVEFARKRYLNDNAAHEQMHRVYKAEVLRVASANPLALQKKTNRWVKKYNFKRPHESLNQQRPAQLYRKSRRRYKAVAATIDYPAWWDCRIVNPSGYISWRARKRVVGRAFAGLLIGLKPISGSHHEVYFEKQLIGTMHESDKGGMRPARWA